MYSHLRMVIVHDSLNVKWFTLNQDLGIMGGRNRSQKMPFLSFFNHQRSQNMEIYINAIFSFNKEDIKQDMCFIPDFERLIN